MSYRNAVNEDNETEEVFNLLHIYYHTNEDDAIQRFLAEDFVSIPHTRRLFEFFASCPKMLISAILNKYGDKFINRKMINVIKKCK